MHTYLHFPIFLYWFVLVLFCLSLSLSFYALACSMAPKHKFAPSWNPFCSGASSSNSTPSHVRFCDEKVRTGFLKNFSQWAFIQNAKSLYRTFPILTLPLSSTIGVGSHCVTSWSLVLSWLFSNLLQYARIRLFCTLVYHSRSRYTLCSHSGYYTQGATYTEGSTSWLPQLWSSSNCV